MFRSDSSAHLENGEQINFNLGDIFVVFLINCEVSILFDYTQIKFNIFKFTERIFKVCFLCKIIPQNTFSESLHGTYRILNI